MELVPFTDIPVSFIHETLTETQKEYIQIKFYIKEAMEKRKGTKADLYYQLAEDMPLSIHTIRKLAQQI